MLIDQRYRIKFSVSKEKVLTILNNKLSKSIFDVGKEYIGTIGENNLEIQLCNWRNSPTIIGEFVEENDEYYLDVRIGYLYMDVLIYIIFFLLLPICTISSSDYTTAFLFLGIGIIFVFVNNRTLKFLKRKFFSELISYDRLCRIAKIN